jgi:hypothetical protein
MNLRDLWDNIVLRDILGYTVPGLVTMFSLAMFVRAVTGMTLPGLVSRVAIHAGLDFLDAQDWTSWRPWVVASLVVPLAYALGHLQIWIADYLEKQGQPWYTGGIALERLLKDSRLGLAYYSTASETLPAVASEPLGEVLQNAAEDCTCSGAADAAKGLFALCDRYVLSKDRDLHGMFMGRYYVLAVLFTNLGVSSMILAVASLAALLASCQVRPNPWLGTDACEFLMSCLVLVGLPAAIGLALIYRSKYFRTRFVECTFPIFYAIVQAEERSKDRQARRQQG